MGYQPTKVQWNAPQYIKQNDQRAFYQSRNWRGLSFYSAAGCIYWRFDGRTVKSRLKYPQQVWRINTEVYSLKHHMNATIINVLGTNEREKTFIFSIKLENGVTIERISSCNLDLAF